MVVEQLVQDSHFPSVAHLKLLMMLQLMTEHLFGHIAVLGFYGMDIGCVSLWFVQSQCN